MKEASLHGMKSTFTNFSMNILQVMPIILLTNDGNKFSKKYVEYTFIDEKNIIGIENINNQEFRDVLLSADIIKAVKEQTINIERQHSKKKKINNCKLWK